MRTAVYPLEIYLDRASHNLRRKMLDSIQLLQSAERLAMRYSPNGFYLAFREEKTVKHYTTSPSSPELNSRPL